MESKQFRDTYDTGSRLIVVAQKGYGSNEYRGERLDELKANPLATDREPWKRQDGEPSLWYNRFYQIYLLKGPKRSLFGAYRQWRAAKGLMKPMAAVPTSWRYYSIKYAWKLRAEAYDDYSLEVLENRIQDERYQMFVRHRKQAQKWGDASMAWLDATPGHRIVGGTLALRAWVASIDVETRSLIPPQVLKLLDMTDAELQQFYASLLTEVVEAEGNEGRPSEDEGGASSEVDSTN